MEQWLPIPDHVGYQVSDFGRVCLLRGRIVTGTLDGSIGYRVVNLRGNDGRWYVRRVHRLVLTAFVGPCPPGMEGCHGPGGAEDNCLTNLRWDTSSANAYDRVNAGNHDCARRETCPLDHALVAPNLVASVLARGGRGCLACSRGRANVYTANRLGRVFDLRIAADEHYAQIMRSHDTPSSSTGGTA